MASTACFWHLSLGGSGERGWAAGEDPNLRDLLWSPPYGGRGGAGEELGKDGEQEVSRSQGRGCSCCSDARNRPGSPSGEGTWAAACGEGAGWRPRSAAASGRPGCCPAAGRGMGRARAPHPKSTPSSCRRRGQSRCGPAPRPRPPGRAPRAPGPSSSPSLSPGLQRPRPRPRPPPPQPPRAGRSRCSGTPASSASWRPRVRPHDLPWRCPETLHDHPWPRRRRRGRRQRAAEPSTLPPSSSSPWGRACGTTEQRASASEARGAL